MNEQLIQALALIAARLEAGGQQLLLESLPASLRDLVAQASTSVVSAEGEGVSILLQELQPPDREAAVQDSDTVPADSDEAAAGSEATDPEATSSRPATFAGTLLGLITIAAVPNRAAHLLDQLPRHLKGQLMQALVTVSSLSASRRDLGTEAAGIAAELRGQLGGGETWGVDKAVEIVRALGDDGRMGRALAALASVDDKALAQIQNSLFPFEDLMTLQDAELQVLMMQVDTRQGPARNLGGDKKTAVRKHVRPPSADRRRGGGAPRGCDSRGGRRGPRCRDGSGQGVVSVTKDRHLLRFGPGGKSTPSRRRSTGTSSGGGGSAGRLGTGGQWRGASREGSRQTGARQKAKEESPGSGAGWIGRRRARSVSLVVVRRRHLHEF